MGRTLGLVKFKDGDIYMTCYNGTCDFMLPFFISKKDLELNYNDSIFNFYDDCFKNKTDVEWDVEDLNGEEVEVYSDYGNGSYWTAKANKERKILIEKTSSDEIEYEEMYSGVPEWAKIYLGRTNDGWNKW